MGLKPQSNSTQTFRGETIEPSLKYYSRASFYMSDQKNVNCIGCPAYLKFLPDFPLQCLTKKFFLVGHRKPVKR